MYITVPNNNIVERYYIINILFHEFLGLKYEICVANDEKDYTVILDNGRKLIIKDSFLIFSQPRYLTCLVKYTHCDNLC